MSELTTPTPPSAELVGLLKKLTSHPDDFTTADLTQSLEEVFAGRSSAAQTSALLVALALTKVDQRPEAIAGAAETLLRHAVPVDVAPHATWRQRVVDIVGTGGDGHNTFNVSTSAAIVAAGAGCKVAKHGSRSSTSNSGSADLLEAFGCNLMNFPLRDLAAHLERANFCFLFAPRFHPQMGRVAAIRKEIGTRTIFNVLGPLINPVTPRRLIVGVHSPYLGPIMAEALRLNGVQHGMVVCGAEGLDEISPAGPTHVWTIYEDAVVSSTVHPDDFGLPVHPLSAVKGESGTANAQYLKRILNGEVPNSPIVDFILLNVSALLVVAGMATSYADGVNLARESITSGRARAALEEFATFTQHETAEA
ncbi:anthranilate phosphoribosyltransferase [Tieghemiomyces parasiticus]|uniref:Anthranilate phosphoribosyltransferase n=1 Tax=Tieghemiomyces parasiticus TaxID=78921 RepID=A0A9W7ZVW5_9FUNG|nr:anthranilate phosphoribosyltransferase [Tieghemiomyces parasiticus]